MVSKTISAIALLIGTTIGAGILGLPYVFAKAGILLGLLHLFIISAVMLLINLYLGEISIRTNGNHQLTGYAEHYLGKIGRRIMFFSMVFGIYSALLAYLIGESNSLSFIFFGTSHYTFLSGLIFWFIMSFLAYFGLKGLKKYEPISVALVILFSLIIIITFIGEVRVENLAYFNPQYFFLPIGVILFAMLGYSSLPELEIILKGKERMMKKAIILGTLIPAVIYAFFAISIAGTIGPATPEIATLALGKIFILLGIITMFTAYATLSISLEDMYLLDYKIKRKKAWLLTTLIPILLFIIAEITKTNSFVNVLGISGAISGGTAGILILLMNQKAKKKGDRKPEYSLPINKIIIIILSIIFIAGAVLEIFLK